jgi:beta-phosphoglucomutase-like phosphatase (HAD superfamily)
MIKGCVFNLIDVVLKQSANEGKTDIDPKLITPDHLVDGFLVFLKELKNKGIQIAVVSKEPALKEILDRLRITHLINNYLTGNIVEILKTTSNIYENVATSLQLIPNEILVFISSEALEDINFLKKFNIVCVGSKSLETTTFHHITDFSSLKFNQLVASVANISQN